MKYIKKFNESNNLESDIDIIRYIFDNEVYHSKTALESEISKIEDDKIKIGLLVELLIRKDLYNIKDDQYLVDIIDLDKIGSKNELIKLHTYYVNSLKKSVKLEYLKYQEKSFPEKEFSDWIKSLSENEVDNLIDFLMEDEIYEMMSIIKELRENI